MNCLFIFQFLFLHCFKLIIIIQVKSNSHHRISNSRFCKLFKIHKRYSTPLWHTLVCVCFVASLQDFNCGCACMFFFLFLLLQTLFDVVIGGDYMLLFPWLCVMCLYTLLVYLFFPPYFYAIFQGELSLFHHFINIVWHHQKGKIEACIALGSCFDDVRI